MSQIYTQRKRTGLTPERTGDNAAPSVAELAAGAAPTTEQMGSRVDLPGEIREKMENSFGADFSSVRLFESQTVADAGAQAVTQGNNIAFAPGKLDLTSTAGQALLGHELSHVVSQSRGESAGRGFLNDTHLEAQADRQGMMAARGESVYEGPVSPIGASSTASAAGPMQAKKNEEKADIQMERQGMKGSAKDLGYFDRRKLAKAYDAEEKRRRENNIFSSGRIDEFDKSEAGGSKMMKAMNMLNAGNESNLTGSARDFENWVIAEFGDSMGNEKYNAVDQLQTGDGRAITGLGLRRSSKDIRRLASAQGMKDDEIKQMMIDLMLKNRKRTTKPSEEEAAEESRRTDEALKKLKGIYYGGFKAARDKYGITMSQLHPEDALNQALSTDFIRDTHIAQDCMQLRDSVPEMFDENNEEDREFMDLNDYYMGLQVYLPMYGSFSDAHEEGQRTGKKNSILPAFQESYNQTKENEAKVLAHDKGNMPKMGEKERKAYEEKALKKYGNMGLNIF